MRFQKILFYWTRDIPLNTSKKTNSVLSFRIWDLILILILFCISFSFLLLFISPNAGSTVVISQYGVSNEYSLDSDKVIELDGGTVYIQNGKVWITDADCSDKICESFGTICNAGESIVCVPNEIVIRIKGGNGVDGIAG